MVGAMARLREQILDPEAVKPLTGKCIVVTRARAQAGELAERSKNSEVKSLNFPL